MNNTAMLNLTSPYDILPNLVKNISGIHRYAFLMKKLHQSNVSVDNDFQKTYFGFYRVRRNNSWRAVYFQFFEQQKLNLNLTFEDVLQHMFKKTNRIEASFCSKLLATIHPNKPIWDKFVLKNLGLKPPTGLPSSRLQQSVKLYQEIIRHSSDMLHSDWGKKAIQVFDENFKDFQWISSIKKVDFFLWQNR